jgi:glycosyltransferase involved in cell wall biosynthesis
MTGSVKRAVRRRVGWLLPYELRNRVLLAHTVPGALLFERREARRLRASRPPALVATVIPTYRRPGPLVAAVESALAQTVRDQVVIVVDDGGGLPELPDDPRLVAVSLSHNIGVAGVVRNVGIRLTDSRFVAFLDDDNTWEPHHLETALAELRRPGGPDGVYTALRRCLPDGGELDVLSVPYDRRAARERAFLDTNAFVARRCRTLRFSRLRRVAAVLPREDWELIYRFGRRRRVVHLPSPTVRYLVNPDTYFSAWNVSPSER